MNGTLYIVLRIDDGSSIKVEAQDFGGSFKQVLDRGNVCGIRVTYQQGPAPPPENLICEAIV